MSGNLAEWADLNPGDPAVRNVYLRGGGYLNGPSAISAFFVSSAGDSTATEDRGFRLAAPVPEPTTYAMALAAMACGGFSMWRRRKRDRVGVDI